MKKHLLFTLLLAALLTVTGSILPTQVLAVPESRESPSLEPGDVIPEGCTYRQCTGEILEAGQTIPDTQARRGDVFFTKEFLYLMDPAVVEEKGEKKPVEGWTLVLNTDKLDPKSVQAFQEPVYGSIAGRPVISAQYTFHGCKNLSEAPELPDSLILLNGAFWGCESLKEAPVIPSSAREISHMFMGCKALESAPAIPGSVEKMTNLFRDCTGLQGSIQIDGENLKKENCRDALYGCEDLEIQGKVSKDVEKAMMPEK